MGIPEQNRYDRLTKARELLADLNTMISGLDTKDVRRAIDNGDPEQFVDLADMKTRMIAAYEILGVELDSMAGIAEAELAQEAQQRDEEEAERRRITEQAHNELKL